uniref:Uncharacterized protein n=1 Tax=Anguilla anguilla TaxID=7936 RepID=A0A0E9P8L3_ANGAN
MHIIPFLPLQIIALSICFGSPLTLASRINGAQLLDCTWLPNVAKAFQLFLNF